MITIGRLLGHVACGSSVFAAQCFGMLDLDGDRMSDLWEIYYEVDSLESTEDNDGDGLNNFRESQLGTNPFEADTLTRITESGLTEDGILIRWESQPYQMYYMEISEDLADWEEALSVTLDQGGEQQDIVPARPKPMFFRLVVGGDYDRDGLSDFEEHLLGYDPRAANSVDGAVGGDLASAIALLNSGEDYSLGSRIVSGQLPSLEEAARFLAQTTLGADMAEIERVASMGFDAWLEEQFEREAGLTEPEIDQRIANELDTFAVHRRYAWWQQVMSSDDLLRQRIAVALSEIYVISDETIDFAPEGLANYYDMLLTQAFGNWRTLLSDVSLHPMMGFYLSHLKNRKADLEANQFPDENFAREIMQLFSIGLFELNADGSRIQDAQGNDIPTYDNEDITNFARVFTGFSWGGPEKNTDEWLEFWVGEPDFDAPMLIWPTEHDNDAKMLLKGAALPAFSDDAGRQPMDDFNGAIDNLFNHPNVGPFISRLLIQRLVTSNPSPEYIRRVATAFADNGKGVRGDLKAVFKAIILDGEARSAAAFTDPRAGRLREPYLRWVRLVKTFNARSDNGGYLIPDWGASDSMGQTILSSPTVFNFFLPDHSPTGLLANEGLFAPEFQILTSNTALATQNYYGGAIAWGFGIWEDDADQMKLNLDAEYALWQDPKALIDRFDLLLTYGTMSAATREVLLEAYNNMPGWFDEEWTVHSMLRLVVLSPDFAIYR